MTKLLEELRGIIATDGPMTLARYMTVALQHPSHGYYVTRDPLGRDGDFTTAPEISQMFGEMLGLWAAHVWTTMGSPARVALVELGPGRGTLMADALRAARAMPAFREAVEVHLVETSPVLRARQKAALGDIAAHWHDRLEDVPEAPTLLLANEFLDALPIHQFELWDGRWYERMVGLDDQGRLTLGIAPEPAPAAFVPAKFATVGNCAVFERSPEREGVAHAIARRVVRCGGAALIIDYGHVRSGCGDTFQAVAKHAYADPFDAPGTVDLTSHVDFEAIAAVARHAGADVHGPLKQGAFLTRLGIGVRAERLAEGKSPEVVGDIFTAHERLTSMEGMGSIFQAIAFAAPGLPAPPPFA
jgi:SAM-dependent MidA family methyltransferase